uniref:Uncharacterized protein n=2 Tax=Ciona savignyi TaxID=51511 RepID=H2YAW4_CIOSA
MQPHQVTEIRGEIKQFVADRKFDEELSRTTRFTYDKDVLTKVIPNFGAISAVKDTYPHSKPRVRNESAASTNSDIVAPVVSTAMAPISATPALASAVSTSNMPSSTNCVTKPLLNPLSSKASATDAIMTSAVPPAHFPLAHLPPAHLPLHSEPHAPQETQKSTPTLKTLEKKASTDSLKLEEDTIDWDKRGPLESPVSWADESPTPQLEDTRPNKMYPRDENGLMPPPNFTPRSAPRGRGRYRGRGNHPGNQGRKFHNNDIYANPLDEPPKHRGDFHKRDPRPSHKKETRQYETHQRKPLQNRPQDNAPESQDHIHRSENHPKSQPHKQDASHQNDQHRQNSQREFPLPQRNRSNRNQRVNNTRDFGGPRKRGDFSQRGNRNQKTSDDLIKNEANS